MRGVTWAAVLALAAGGAGAAHPAWTRAQAESIHRVRGLPVHVRSCRGLGPARRAGATVVYRRFACLAGARLPHERFDTVAVTYVLHPLGPYRGRSSRYELTNVRFEGIQVP